MPSVTASISIPATQEKVWAVVSDVGNAQRWNKAWNRIELTTESREGRGTRFLAHVKDEDGGEQTSEFEVTEWIAPEYIEFTPVRNPAAEQDQLTIDYHSLRIVPLDEETTRVDLTAEATAHSLRGRFAGMLLWPGHQRPGLEAALSSLARLFSAVPPDDSS